MSQPADDDGQRVRGTGWKTRAVPAICERLIGFSIPKDDRILVVSHEGTHLLRLGEQVTIEHDDRFAPYDIYDPDMGIAHYEGSAYSIIGLHGGAPLLESPQGERLILDADGRLLVEPSFELRYQNFSGDWSAATFSPDGRWIALGCPYDFDFVLLERAGG